MNKIIKTIGFTILFLVFFSSPFVVGTLSQYLVKLGLIKTNIFALVPTELFFYINWFILAYIIYFFRNF